VHFWSSAPAGYGYTGTIDVFAVDGNECPTGLALASTTLLPVSGWNGVGLGHVDVPPNFAVSFTFGSAPATPASITSDHPAPGPTGPAACGTCYATTRSTHSYYWGNASSVVCPGSTFFDGVCDAAFLWDVSMHCQAPVSLQSTSWGAIKGLYR
jgi:hypothetical protein